MGPSLAPTLVYPGNRFPFRSPFHVHTGRFVSVQFPLGPVRILTTAAVSRTTLQHQNFKTISVYISFCGETKRRPPPYRPPPIRRGSVWGGRVFSLRILCGFHFDLRISAVKTLKISAVKTLKIEALKISAVKTLETY